MALTPLRNPPARLRTISCGRQPRKTEQKIKIKRRSLRSQASDCRPFPGCRQEAGTTGEHPRMAWIYRRSRKSVEGGVGPVAGA
ncbi:hypothetical protein FJP65_14280 [Stenotrophomonas maltophilia]|nr:hypothetical protein FJP65_14280 [Stenotrophomonas maltophilia]